MLVTRLNGGGLPATREEWEAAHPRKNYAKDKDSILPGYKEVRKDRRRCAIGRVVGRLSAGTDIGSLFPSFKSGDT